MTEIDSEADRLDRAIGTRLRRARKARKFTQSQLGDALGVTFQQIQKYERGVNRVSSSALILIARALQVSPLEIIGEDNPPDSGLDWDFMAVDGANELIESYSSITDPKLRRAILDLSKRLAEADRT